MGMRAGCVAVKTRIVFQGFALVGLGIGFLLSLGAAPVQAQSSSQAQCITQALTSGNGTVTCGSGSTQITAVCSFSGGVETCNFSGACTGTANSAGVNTITCAGPSSAGQAIVTAGQTAVQASRVSLGAVQSQLTNIRDQIQRRGPTTSRPIGFAGEPESESVANGPVNSAFEALAYATKAPVYKAPPPPPPPGVTFGTWAQGFGDYETRAINLNGVDFGRTTRTFGGIAGVDATIPRLFNSDAFVIGILGGETVSRIANADGSSTRVSGPSVGVYTVSVYGGFSIDSVSKVDFFNLNSTSPVGVVTPLGMTNYTSAYNVNYKIQMANNWWVEPTAGVSYTYDVWDSASHAIGLQDGRQWRGQVGARTGTSFDWNGVRVDPSLTVLAYDDFYIAGNTIVTAGAGPGALVPTDEGYIFGQVIGKLNFDWGRGLSSYVEAEARGRQNVFGAAGRVGMRYVFDWAPPTVVTKY